MHNLIVCDELDWYQRELDFNKFQREWPQYHASLVKLIGEEDQMNLF